MTDALRRTADWLGRRGTGTPRLDAEVLLAAVLGVDRLALYTDHDRPLTGAEMDAYRELVARRGRGEPVAYLLGRRGFRRLSIAVSPDVLVPRPETELLVEWALAVAPARGVALDWGTGSGAVALALADERPDLIVTGLDRSPAALAVARSNAEAAGLCVELVHSDGLAAVPGRTWDVIAANPPYLSDADLADGPPELAHEPREALVAGPTGLEELRRLAAEAPARLRPGGWLLAEVGDGQAASVERLWRDAGLERVEARRDLAGVPRVVGGRRPADRLLIRQLP